MNLDLKEYIDTIKLFRLILITLLLQFIACRQEMRDSDVCDQNKAFISVDKYTEAQYYHEDSANIAPIEIFQSICFDSLRSFCQIDSLEANARRTNPQICNGVIPLKFCYLNDTILLSAFHFSNNCFVDFNFRNRLTINLDSNGIHFETGNSRFKLNDTSAVDLLGVLFERTIKPFFEIQKEIQEKVKDDDLAKKKANELRWLYNWLIVVEVQNDDQLVKMKTPLDYVLKAYLSTLNKSSIQFCNKKICEMDPDEVKLYSKYLFLNFEMRQKY